MSSWPPPGYVPPSSAPGSRSPADANGPMKYPPGPEHYPNDGWGSRDRELDRERDGWGRDREWNDYDRRRPDWEPRRGQGYQGDHPRRHRSPARTRGPLDPYSVDIPVSFRAFCEWYRYHHPEAAQEEEKVKREANEAGKELDKASDPMRAHFDAYKRKMLLKQNNMLFNAHKSQVWFIERYDPAPEHVALRDRIKAEGRKGRTARFVQELDEGKYDPIVEDPTTVTTEDKPEGSPRAEGGGDSTNDNELDFDNDNDEEGNSKPTAEATENGKAKGGPQGGRDVECSMDTEGNQVMIRTLPPDIGRVKLEQALNTIPGFVYVTFGEPTFKKNFYRAAWIRFADDADMDLVMNSLSELKIDNFKLHTTRIVRPFTGRARITPSAACHPQRLTKDLARAKQLAHIYEEESRVLNRVQDVSEAANGETEDESSLGSGCEHVERRFEKLVAELEEKEGGSDGPNFTAKSLGIQLDLYLAYYALRLIVAITVLLVQTFPKNFSAAVSSTPGTLDERWLEWLDHKIAVLAEPDKVDPAEYGAKNYDDELSRCVEDHIKQEEEGKFRCKTCTKLFKATSFVEKHIANKHPELTGELETMLLKQNNMLFNAHKNQVWFIERYDPAPEHVALRDRIKAEGRKTEGRKGRTARFVQELDEGKYDPIVEDPSTATTEDKPEGSPRAEGGGDSTNDNELDFDNDNDEEGNSKPTAEATENGKAKGGPQGGRDVECSMDTEGNQVMIRTLPPDIGRVKLEQALNTIPGFVYVTFGEPTFKKNFYRAAWIRFADDADMDLVMNSLSELKIDNFKLHTTRIVRPFTGRARITPSAACHPQRLTKDLARAKQLAHIYEEESRVLNRVQDVSDAANGETEDESSLGSGCEHVERRFEKLVAELEEKEGGSDGPNFTAKSLGIQLDLYLAYLRTAFNCCYYCAARADFPEELQRRCLKHSRPSVIVSASDPLSDERWLEWLDHKIAVLAEPDKVDPAEYGAKNYDE
ncbi:hypothetical protein RSAG8_00818, partial [Rhizoctonia solani AG-8 WAC10335]